MSIFVFYSDDHADCGGVGLAEFNSKSEAAKFISERMVRAEKPDVGAYRIFNGQELKATAVEFAMRIDIN